MMISGFDGERFTVLLYSGDSRAGWALLLSVG
jgi:hypothetical protein